MGANPFSNEGRTVNLRVLLVDRGQGILVGLPMVVLAFHFSNEVKAELREPVDPSWSLARQRLRAIGQALVLKCEIDDVRSFPPTTAATLRWARDHRPVVLLVYWMLATLAIAL